MKRSFAIGNDVVDLGNARTVGKASDERFVGRVCAPGELAGIAESEDPDLELWCHWASKEAAFKVASKRIGRPPPFIHRAFVVSWDAAETAEELDGAELLREGCVSYAPPDADSPGAGYDAVVRVRRHGEALHAVAYGPADTAPLAAITTYRVERLDDAHAVWAGALEELESRFSPRELDAVYSRESAAVRLGARAELADFLQVPERDVEIVCAPGPTSQRPPYVLLKGEPMDIDVSLSHDGPWIAWAWWHAC